ncbi:MAG TPA: hypothetical protein VJV04_13840 [Nitrospiraceae bacterium]|nr:hypothetical protein [Nitrospiraceae bacterium]
MALIWCSISGHGFGHAAQVVPVLNELGRLIPSLKVILRTAVPAWYFQDQLQVPWDLSVSEQDVGCVQEGPLHIDVGGTWAAYHRFHENWEDRVTEETTAIKNHSPHIVISDIAYLAIEAAASANIPVVGLSSICWDQVLMHFHDKATSESASVIKQIQCSYALADLMIRVAPAISMPVFRRPSDISPIAMRAEVNRQGVRYALGASVDERIVVIAFGGIRLTSLPWNRIEAMTGYRFIVPGPVPSGIQRVVSSEALPFRFQTIMASCDIILTKPGYGTIVEAVASGTRVVYVRRYNFADEVNLLAYLHRYGYGLELSIEDFLNGRWEQTLQAVMAVPALQTSPPAATGAAEAADILKRYMG